MQQLESKIIANQALAPDFYELILKYPGVKAQPGQFVELRLTDGIDPFLNRPFSISWAKKDQIAIWYQIRGTGTKWLKNQKAGKFLQLIGPLGNSFPKLTGKSIYIVGGCGTGPIYFLASLQKPETVIIGGRDRKHVYQRQAFKKLGIKTLISTDDGSLGKRGFVTDLLKSELNKQPYDTVAACGPNKMMEAVAALAEVKDISCLLSLEAYMACGLGACFGCSILTKDGYKRVCHDGPVFDSREIVWNS